MTAARDPKLDAVLTASPVDAWQAVFDKLREVFSAPLSPQHAEREVMERERKVDELELLLSSSAWELWREFESAAPRTSKAVIEFWGANPSGKAVLILDGLSLREMPWLGHQPPCGRPWSMAQSSAARSAPVWPPETILCGNPFMPF